MLVAIMAPRGECDARRDQDRWGIRKPTPEPLQALILKASYELCPQLRWRASAGAQEIGAVEAGAMMVVVAIVSAAASAAAVLMACGVLVPVTATSLIQPSGRRCTGREIGSSRSLSGFRVVSILARLRRALAASRNLPHDPGNPQWALKF